MRCCNHREENKQSLAKVEGSDFTKYMYAPVSEAKEALYFETCGEFCNGTDSVSTEATVYKKFGLYFDMRYRSDSPRPSRGAVGVVQVGSLGQCPAVDGACIYGSR